MGGKVVKYDTEAFEGAQASFYGEMFSDDDYDDDSSKAFDSPLKPKKVLDKWQMLAEDKAKERKKVEEREPVNPYKVN